VFAASLSRVFAPLVATVVIAIGWNTCLAQDSKKDAPASEPASDIRDAAAIFDEDAVRKARASIRELEGSTKVPTLIETIRTTGGDPLHELVTRNAARWGKDGVYILIDRNERGIVVTATGRAEARVGKSSQRDVRQAFVDGFRHGDFEKGLAQGVLALKKALADTVVASVGEGSPVVRNQTRLTLMGARLIIAGAEAKAAELKLKVNVAVVDDGGHLLSFDRMDGARPASGYTALTKATTAATFRQETGPFPKGAATPDVLLSLSLQNAAAASGGKATTLLGGVPVVVDGQVVGGVGVGGGTGEQDAVIAKAGLARLLSELGPVQKVDSAGAPEAK
jgi:glc operon protein GlcG